MSEDDKNQFLSTLSGWTHREGIKKTPNDPDMVFKGFIKFTGLPESKMAKTPT